MRRLRRNLRDYGRWVTLRKAAAQLFSAVYLARDLRIYRMDLCWWEPQVAAAAGETGSLEYRFVGPQEEAIIRQIETMEEWLQDTVERRLQQGALCLAALERGTLAGFNLVSFGQVHIPLLRCTRRFRPDQAWSEQISVDPRYRGQGTATQLRYRVFAELQRRGVRFFYGGTLAYNAASLALARKVGFRQIAEVRYRRLLHRPRWRCVRLRP
ncbi:MAG: GNAT family N-acetyltransferase [Candidatus Latescibacterota bacterium]